MKIVELKCPSCFAPLKHTANSDVVVCEYCGTTLSVERSRPEPEKPEARPVRTPVRASDLAPEVAPMPVQVLDPVIGSAAIRTVASDGPNKSRILTAVLAFVLGFLGFHHFYLGNRRLGLIYLVFFWTNIPLWVSWLEGLSCLLMGKDTWQYRRYGVLVTWKGVLASVVVFALLGIIASFG